MIKNLSVTNTTSYKVDKFKVHRLVNCLRKDLDFRIGSFTINFIHDHEIIPVNKKYLGHDYSTDIITFNYSGENYTLDGEIFISLDDASYYADKFGVNLGDEITRLIIHGFLHMVGYNDAAASEKRKMKNIENSLTNKYLNFFTKID